jgi:hypothetical protein
MRAARRHVAALGDSSSGKASLIVVEQEDLVAAAAAAVPSLSLDDLERFDRLHSSFSVGGSK